MAAVPELFRHYPMLRNRLPWTALARPTRVEALALPPHRAPAGSLWIKRDDQTSHVYGGHAAREFEFILGDALRRGTGRLLVFADASSTRGLALATLARSFELEVILALAGHPDGSKAAWLREQEQRLGVPVFPLYRGPWQFLRLLRSCVTPGARRGRSRLPSVLWPRKANLLETLGATNGIFELQRQIRCGILPEPDFIYVGCDSLPTLAGLAAGCELAGLRSRLVTLQPEQIQPASQLAQRVFRFLQQQIAPLPRLALRADRIATRTEEIAPSPLPEALASLDLATAASKRALQAFLADASRGFPRGAGLFWLADAPQRLSLARTPASRRRASPAHA
jgi:1-aminocyclopropane-1-carboxylate deaminase/D-cysteine desulfhydrase-like pyridoxal-dependent ACC family enzyme